MPRVAPSTEGLDLRPAPRTRRPCGQCHFDGACGIQAATISDVNPTKTETCTAWWPRAGIAAMALHEDPALAPVVEAGPYRAGSNQVGDFALNRTEDERQGRTLRLGGREVPILDCDYWQERLRRAVERARPRVEGEEADEVVRAACDWVMDRMVDEFGVSTGDAATQVRDWLHTFERLDRLRREREAGEASRGESWSTPDGLPPIGLEVVGPDGSRRILTGAELDAAMHISRGSGVDRLPAALADPPFGELTAAVERFGATIERFGSAAFLTPAENRAETFRAALATLNIAPPLPAPVDGHFDAQITRVPLALRDAINAALGAVVREGGDVEASRRAAIDVLRLYVTPLTAAAHADSWLRRIRGAQAAVPADRLIADAAPINWPQIDALIGVALDEWPPTPGIHDDRASRARSVWRYLRTEEGGFAGNEGRIALNQVERHLVEWIHRIGSRRTSYPRLALLRGGPFRRPEDRSVSPIRYPAVRRLASSIREHAAALAGRETGEGVSVYPDDITEQPA